MASNRASLLHPEARLPPVGKAKQIKAAEEMKKSIEDKAAKRSLDIPPYDFLELIGKGSFGRVFKRFVLQHFFIAKLALSSHFPPPYD